MAGIVRQDYRIFKIFKINPENRANPVILSQAYSEDSLPNLFLLRSPKLMQFPAQLRLAIGEYGDREKRRIYRAGLADRERCHRNSARHLYRRQERIQAIKSIALYRHAEHRQRRMRGKNAGQVGRAACRRYDNFQPARLRR